MRKRLQSVLLMVTLLIGLLAPAASVNAAGVDEKLLEKRGFELPTVFEVPAEEYVGLPAIEQATTAEISVTDRMYWTQFGSDYYYYNFFNDAEKAFWDSLEEGCIALATSTQDSDEVYAHCDASIPQNQMINLMLLFMYSNPQYYFISNYFGYYPEGSGSWYGGYFVVYDEFVDGDARMAATTQFTSRMDVWMNEVEAQVRPEERVKRAHDIVCQNTDYYFNDFDQSAYSLVCMGQTVCAGYAKTMQMLLNAVGIESLTVTSYDHAWNIVQLHDVWYELDATWDDGEGTDVFYSYYNKSRQTFEYKDASGSHDICMVYKDEYGYRQINYTGMQVDAPYDMYYYSGYVSPYFVVDNVTYFVTNDNQDIAELLVTPVNANGSVPLTVTYNNKTYKVIGGSADAGNTGATAAENVRAFVERMYTVALGRAAEESGAAYWAEQLLAGDNDGAGIARGFILSPEFMGKGYDDTNYVNVLYKTFFNREPAAEEVSYWTGTLAAGNSRELVLAGFVNSNEFDVLCTSYGISRGFLRQNGEAINPGIGQFAERLYTEVLERAGEKEGIEYWTLQIADGACTPVAAAQSFFMSAEYMNKKTSNVQYIEACYRTFMGREADTDGVIYWKTYLTNGATREAVLAGFSNSGEFQQIMREYGL